MSTDDLPALRRALNRIDARLIETLAERQGVVGQVGALKTSGTRQLRDVPREEDLLTRLVALGGQQGLDSHFVTRIFQEILEHSVRRQQEQLLDRDNPDRAAAPALVVTYLGAEGSYSHQAAARHFAGRDGQVVLRGGPSFTALVEGVRRADCDFTVLPIENTTAGSINEVYDLLDTEPVFIVGEEVQRVDHGLLVLPGVQFAEVQRIVGHPQALTQCSRFLRRVSQCTVEAVADTATGVRRVADSKDRSLAAIGNAVAARRYGLDLVWPDIANQPENLTRFVVVANDRLRCDDRIPCKTSLLFTTPHTQGSLLKALGVLSNHKLNLTKLESRPKLGEPWNYRFYIDFVGTVSDAMLATIFEDLGPFTTDVQHLGTYPAKTNQKPAEPRSVG